MAKATYEAFLASMSPLQGETPYAKILIYGEAGAGKTVLACTLGERILYIDAVEGWVSLRNHPELAKKVTRVKYEGLSQLDTMVELITRGDLDFDTLILDEASTIAMLDLDTVIAARAAKDVRKDPDVPTQPDFFANTERCRRTFYSILNLPINVVLVAHVREDKDERTGAVEKRPSFSPKLRTTIINACHLVGYLTADERGEEYTRNLQTMPVRGIEAKNRIGGINRVVKNPNLSVLLADFIVEEDKQDEPVDVDGPVSDTILNEFGE